MTTGTDHPPQAVAGMLSRTADRLRRFFDSDVFYSFRTSPVTVAAFVVTMVCFVAAFFAPWLAPHTPTTSRRSTS